MSAYQRWKVRSDTDFSRYCGVNHKQFLVLLEKLKVQMDLDKQHSRGRPSQMSLEDKLLMTLKYLRDYPTFFVLADWFKISEGYSWKVFTKVSKYLVAILALPKSDDLSLDTIIIDVTEQRTERPKKNSKSLILVKPKPIPPKL